MGCDRHLKRVDSLQPEQRCLPVIQTLWGFFTHLFKIVARPIRRAAEVILDELVIAHVLHQLSDLFAV